MKKLSILIPALLTFGLGVSAALAQTGSLVVSVTHEAGPAEGAEVVLEHPLGYIARSSTATDREGRAEFPVLRVTGQAGVGYVVTVGKSGFGHQVVRDVRVRASQTTLLPIELASAVVERIEVVARSETINLESSAQSTKFSDAFIADLPVAGRFYQNLLTLVAGVQDSDGDGNPNVHGSRDRDFKALVSGVSNVDPLTGQQMSQVNPNSIEELEVITAGAGVEFSRAQGGFARIVQKQGSNDFEGIVELFYRSSRLDGDGAGGFSDIAAPEFEWFQPALQLSGPIVRDKLWFRLSHEMIDREIPTNVTTGIVTVREEWGIHSDQLTWQPSPRNKLSLHFQADPRTIDNFGVSSTTAPESAILVDRQSDSYSLIWTSPISPRLLVESQAAWQDLDSSLTPAVDDARNRCLRGPDFLETARCFDSDTGRTSGPFPFDVDDRRQRLTARVDATLYGGRFWGMTHQLKFGSIVENERYFRDKSSRPDVTFFVFDFTEDSTNPSQSLERTAVIFGDFSAPERTQVRATGVTWALYAEDQLKPLSNLTITAGLRIEREEIDSNGRQPFSPEDEFRSFADIVDRGFPATLALQTSFTAYERLEDFYLQLAETLDVPFEEIKSRQSSVALASTFWNRARRDQNIRLTNTNLSPFLSVAWDPWSNGKTKLAASVRRYHDKVFLALPLVELEADSAFVAFDAENRGGLWNVRPGIDGLRTSISPTVDVHAVDRDLRTPYQDELTLSFEREIATETTIKLTYIDRAFRDQFQDLDLNHVPADLGRCRFATLLNPSPLAPVREGDPDYDATRAPGDGIIDDCAGLLDFSNVPSESDPFGSGFLLQRPDGFPDLYVQNPGWGNLLLVGNFNRIDYEAYVLELLRRQYRNWELRGSYTWSRAEGDGEDFQQALLDDRSLVDEERGYQAYDQRHAVKAQATTITPWGFRLGGALTWQSGLPYSVLQREVSLDIAPPQLEGVGAGAGGRPRTFYPTRRRNDQRNDSYWNVDARISRELRIGRDVAVQLSAEVFNLLNDDTYLIYDPLSESGRQVNGVNTATRRFGREWQLGLRVAF